MHFHFEANKSQESIARAFSGDNFHWPSSSFKLFIQSFDDIGCSQRNPFLLGVFEIGQTSRQGIGEAFDGRGQFLLPFLLKVPKEEAGLFLRRGIENRTKVIGDVFFQFSRYLKPARFWPNGLDIVALEPGKTLL